MYTHTQKFIVAIMFWIYNNSCPDKCGFFLETVFELGIAKPLAMQASRNFTDMVWNGRN